MQTQITYLVPLFPEGKYIKSIQRKAALFSNTHTRYPRYLRSLKVVFPVFRLFLFTQVHASFTIQLPEIRIA